MNRVCDDSANEYSMKKLVVVITALTTAKPSSFSNIQNYEPDNNNSVTVNMYRLSAEVLSIRNGCCYVLLHNLCKKQLFYNLYQNRNETCTILMFA